MDEYISRKAVIETIRYRVCQGHGNKEHICKLGSCAYCGIMEIMNDISNIEAADVQPVEHGRWIRSDDGYWLTCPFCNAEVDVSVGILIYVDNDEVNHINFCPNCGKEMDFEG